MTTPPPLVCLAFGWLVFTCSHFIAGRFMIAVVPLPTWLFLSTGSALTKHCGSLPHDYPTTLVAALERITVRPVVWIRGSVPERLPVSLLRYRGSCCIHPRCLLPTI
jgi:hypothetical protein